MTRENACGADVLLCGIERARGDVAASAVMLGRRPSPMLVEEREAWTASGERSAESVALLALAWLLGGVEADHADRLCSALELYASIPLDAGLAGRLTSIPAAISMTP